MVNLVACPVCGGEQFQPARTKQEIQAEIRTRTEFVRERISWKPKRNEVKDLLDFMHGCPAAVYSCTTCGVLQRGERVTSYEDDPNDPDLMRTVLPRYIAAFRDKRELYEPLLPPHAEVLEIGPHLGAFLRVAAEWDWNPTGLDVGRDTTEFIRSLGHKTSLGSIEEAHLGEGKYDGVFIWNCFEQLIDPVSPLKAARRVLKRHGVLVLRVPNAEFRGGSMELAYNNLLGWPYLYGYGAKALQRLAEGNGFRFDKRVDSELLTMPFPEVTSRIAEEQELARKLSSGSWIEMVFRRAA